MTTFGETHDYQKLQNLPKSYKELKATGQSSGTQLGNSTDMCDEPEEFPF